MPDLSNAEPQRDLDAVTLAALQEEAIRAVGEQAYWEPWRVERVEPETLVQDEPGAVEPDEDDAAQPEPEAASEPSTESEPSPDDLPEAPAWEKDWGRAKRIKAQFDKLTPAAQEKAEALGLTGDYRALYEAAKRASVEGQIWRLELYYHQQRDEPYGAPDPDAPNAPPPEPEPSVDEFIRRAQQEAEAAKKARSDAAAKAKAEKRSAKRNEKILAGTKTLTIGSDIEIARCVIADLCQQYGDVVYDDGEFYYYDEQRWVALHHEEERLAVHPYDGAIVGDDPDTVTRLSKNRIDSVLSEMRAMLMKRDFFKNASVGINCASGFIKFDTDPNSPTFGQPTLVDHSPDHRCRHVLLGEWRPGDSGVPPEGSLLYKLQDGVFKGDADANAKKRLLRQIAGCAALGYATMLRKQKCIIVWGKSADNGKSQLLDMIRGVVPPSAIASVPAAKLSDQSFLVRIAGKLLNATDELSGTAAIAGETFKACVTGNPVTARDLYRSAIEFRPVALHFFATNKLPKFSGGFDRGVLRRLLLFEVNRVIPDAEKIENIGLRIVEEEPDLLLAYAVDGASDLIKQREFTVPPSSDVALKSWVRMADPVMAWAAARVKIELIDPGQKTVGHKSAMAYGMFRDWALAAGYHPNDIPAVSGFVQRLTSIPGIKVNHGRAGNSLIGFSILGDDREEEADVKV